MSYDDFMSNWMGAGVSTSPSLYPSGIGAFCDYTNIPAAQVYTTPVTFDFEAWFTGAIDASSLSSHIATVDAKLVGYMASSMGLCDTISCIANTNNCNDIYNRANTLGAFTGITKNSTDIIQINYQCEQPKPINQLPIFNRIVCIPITASILVQVPTRYNATEVQNFIWKAVNSAMASGKLTTENQVVGLVFTGTPHTKMNTSGTIHKEMRGLGLGLLISGCTILFLLIVTFITWLVIKRRNRLAEEEYDDLSLEKELEDSSSFALTDSFQTDDFLTPKSDRIRKTP